jgi:hypothetical protein
LKPTTSIVIAAVAFAGGLGLGIGGTTTTAGHEQTASAPSASGPSSFAPPPTDVVLARVNGVPITRADLQLKLDTGSHEAVPSPEHEQSTLDALITREVLAQRARTLGLTSDPVYIEAQKKLGAQARDFERQALSEILLRREGDRRAPTEEAARSYFEQNRPRISTELHVLQILRRSEAQAIEARNAIQNGTPFEDVAKSLFPGLPEGQTPWDLGFMSFSKIPEPWREWVYELKAGETSGIIRGPNERFWIVKVVEVRQNASVTFESVREAVLADMARSGRDGARAALEAELRATAKIELLTPTAP